MICVLDCDSLQDFELLSKMKIIKFHQNLLVDKDFIFITDKHLGSRKDFLMGNPVFRIYHSMSSEKHERILEYKPELQGLWSGFTNLNYYETVQKRLGQQHGRNVEIIHNRDDLSFIDGDCIILKGFDQMNLDLSLNPVDNLPDLANSLCEVLDGFNWKETIFYLGQSSE
jgi:hypothetical protein